MQLFFYYVNIKLLQVYLNKTQFFYVALNSLFGTVLLKGNYVIS